MGGGQQAEVAWLELEVAATGIGVTSGVLVGGGQVAANSGVDLGAAMHKGGYCFDRLATHMTSGSIQWQTRVAEEDDVMGAVLCTCMYRAIQRKLTLRK